MRGQHVLRQEMRREREARDERRRVQFEKSFVIKKTTDLLEKVRAQFYDFDKSHNPTSVARGFIPRSSGTPALPTGR